MFFILGSQILLNSLSKTSYSLSSEKNYKEKDSSEIVSSACETKSQTLRKVNENHVEESESPESQSDSQDADDELNTKTNNTASDKSENQSECDNEEIVEEKENEKEEESDIKSTANATKSKDFTLSVSMDNVSIREKSTCRGQKSKNSANTDKRSRLSKNQSDRAIYKSDITATNVMEESTDVRHSRTSEIITETDEHLKEVDEEEMESRPEVESKEEAVETRNSPNEKSLCQINNKESVAKGHPIETTTTQKTKHDQSSDGKKSNREASSYTEQKATLNTKHNKTIDGEGSPTSQASSNISVGGNQIGSITKLDVPSSVVSFNRTKKR